MRRRIAVSGVIGLIAALLVGLIVTRDGEDERSIDTDTGQNGLLYAAVGSSDSRSRLVIIDLKTLRSQSATSMPFFVSEVSARHGMVAASGITTDKNLSVDRLYLFANGKLTPMPGLEGEQAFSPLVEDESHITYTQIEDPEHGNEERKRYVVRTIDTSSSRVALRYSSRNRFNLQDIGPQGDIVVTEAETLRSARVAIIRAGRRIRSFIRPRIIPGGGSIRWGSGSNLLALSGRPAELSGGARWDEIVTAVARPDNGSVIGFVRGWKVIDWSRDGRKLLVSRMNSLGLLTGPDWNTVQPLGSVPGEPIWFGSWAS